MEGEYDGFFEIAASPTGSRPSPVGVKRTVVLRIRFPAGTVKGAWRRFLCVAMVALLGVSCGTDPPPDDLDYLVWEVCRQVRIEGQTADDVSGILVDASRHGAVMDRIEAECGDEIAAVYRDSE